MNRGPYGVQVAGKGRDGHHTLASWSISHGCKVLTPRDVVFPVPYGQDGTSRIRGHRLDVDLEPVPSLSDVPPLAVVPGFRRESVDGDGGTVEGQRACRLARGHRPFEAHTTSSLEAACAAVEKDGRGGLEGKIKLDAVVIAPGMHLREAIAAGGTEREVTSSEVKGAAV